MDSVEIEGKKYSIKITFKALEEIEKVLGGSVVEILLKKGENVEKGLSKTTELSARECYVILKNSIYDDINNELIENFIANNLMQCIGITTQILANFLYGNKEESDQSTTKEDSKKN